MPLHNLFQRIADKRIPRTRLERAVQSAMAVVAPVYGAGAWANRALYDLGAKSRTRLPAMVLSVGNISLGGTGKTPFTIWLAEWLRENGRPTAILTRGYGRADEDRLTIVHDGRRLRSNTRQAGDEPVMMARALQRTPIIACSDRARAGRAAIDNLKVDTLILDDGLQHHRLERQAEIILLDATRPITELRLFPRGTLREPLTVLSKAHLIVLTRADQSKRTDRIRREIRRRLPHVPVVRTRIAVSGLMDLSARRARPASDLEGARVLIACGVGNPASVKHTVQDLGATVGAMKVLADHSQVTRADVLAWDSARRRAKADFLVVTEKDAVKLRELGKLPDGILALRTQMEFVSDRDQGLAEKALRARLRAGQLRGYLS
ncbi:tetraacyldisaccharide 4'-kinase [bacterium]|nr:tetraacyldisaccharide 4'-kinase [bacterium]